MNTDEQQDIENQAAIPKVIAAIITFLLLVIAAAIFVAVKSFGQPMPPGIVSGATPVLK